MNYSDEAEIELVERLYSVKIALHPDDETEVVLAYEFNKPKVASYDRYVKRMSQSVTRAGKRFVLDNIIPEQEGKLLADLEEYPALAIKLSEKLLGMLGLSDEVSVKKL